MTNRINVSIRCEVMQRTEAWPFVRRCENSAAFHVFPPEGVAIYFTDICQAHATEAIQHGARVEPLSV